MMEVQGGNKCLKCTQRAIFKQTISLKIFFFSTLELVIKTLISSVVDPEDVISSLPKEIALQLRAKGAGTIQDIFKEDGPLDKRLNWYDIRLLLSIVNKFGDYKCKRALNDYNIQLQNYLISRIHLNTQLYSKDPINDQETVIMVDPEWEKELMEKNNPACDYIASLLGTTRNKFHFKNQIF